jgi:hypothetical protein
MRGSPFPSWHAVTTYLPHSTVQAELFNQSDWTLERWYFCTDVEVHILFRVLAEVFCGVPHYLQINAATAL